MKNNIFKILLDKYLILTEYCYAISPQIWEVLAPSLNEELQELLSEMVMYNGSAVAVNILLTSELNNYFDALYNTIAYKANLDNETLGEYYFDRIRDFDKENYQKNKMHLQTLVNMNLQLAPDEPTKQILI